MAFAKAQPVWQVKQAGGHFELSGSAMHAFCHWLVRTSTATKEQVRDLRHRVVRVHQRGFPRAAESEVSE